MLQRRVGAAAIAQPDTGHAQREELVDVVEVACPFIGAQSPLSTTSRAFIEASSLFSDDRSVAFADFALDVADGREGAGDRHSDVPRPGAPACPST